MEKFDPAKIEEKWQKKWAADKLFKVDIKNAEKPFFNLMMFPYPSGEGLHVGHVYAFGGSDSFGRLQRLRGYSVFEPMGFDSFGIHSENYAISKNIHPATLIKNTTQYFREKQLKKLGCLFDWDHQVITSDSDYYRWTQWIFVKLFKAGLAVRKKASVLWCPKCLTVLAYEQVIAGKCERCETAVIQKELEQWFFKITNYADRLLKNLDYIDWSENTKQMQRNWIGRSEGIQIEFKVQSLRPELRPRVSEFKINVFTTRPDTIFGATFIVLAVDNPQVLKITDTKYLREVKKFIETAGEQIDREVTPDQKIGEFLGSYCINPLTNKPIPIYVANYVLAGYGTGAIMGVPAHDSRDYEFAKKYHLDIVKVIEPLVEKKELLDHQAYEAYEGEGKLINSEKFTDLSSQEARDKISEYIEVNHQGNRKVNYHLRDWLISRQRYWGPPIPMVYCQSCASKGDSWFTLAQTQSKTVFTGETDWAKGWYPVPEKELPVTLPYIKNYQPKGTGVSPLASDKSFIKVACPSCGLPARRETDVSDTFLDSSWYYLRYPSIIRQAHDGEQGRTTRSARSGQAPFDPDLTRKWLPVDMYIGGNEHAVLHLLYTRFVTMALTDLGYLNFEEPFNKFRAHGLIIHQGVKMSKSRGNVINPNFYIEKYGSDTLRMYLLFIGPFDQGGDFSDRGIVGIWRFVNKVWRIVLGVNFVDQISETQLKFMHKTINKVTIDLENLNFNTAIAALMEWFNFLQERVNKRLEISREEMETFLILLAPLAPHLTEELWGRLGNKYSINNQKWPRFNEEYLKEDKVIVVIQVDGKVRDKVEIDRKLDKEMITRLALDRERIKRYIKEKAKNYIYVEGKLLNIVTK